MKNWQRWVCGIVLAAASCLCSGPLMAQQEGAEKPKPAAREYPPLLSNGNNQQDPDQGGDTTQPDDRPLSGVQAPTLGTPEIRHSYWFPGIRYSNNASTNSLNPAANSGWNATNYVSGDLSILEAWSHTLLSMNYSGGGFFSTDPAQGNGQYHQLAAAYEIDQRRWQALFIDEFSHLPQSEFGFGGPSGLAFAGITGTLSVPLPGLQPVFLPGQTILGTSGPRSSNASAAQFTYRISRRGSFTIAGAHGLLRFAKSGNIDSDTEILNAGYNYAITHHDTVGLIYRFSAYHFPGEPQALGDHTFQFAYARKVTGRMALQLAGGPEVTSFRVAINGTTQRVSGTATALLVYAFHQASVRLSYSHGVSTGGGLLNGASTDLVNASWNRQFTRVWAANINIGYAKNRQLLAISGLTSPSYNSWIAGTGVSRPLGRSANFSFGYQAQIQSANVALCNSSNCGTSATVHQVFTCLQWHARPLVLR
jgi:hypothetical protein